MNKDDHLIFEAYNYKKAMQSDKARVKKKGIGGAMDAAVQRLKQSIKDEPLNSLEKNPRTFKNAEDAESTDKLKYTYEIATANLPRDIDTSTKEGELKVLDLAYKELLKHFSKYKNPTLAARNTLNDEDMPGEIITQYNVYKRDGFPGEERAETPQQYAQDSEKDYPSQKLGSEDAESAEQKQERIARKWELNKQRWDKWKKENPEKAKLNAQRKAGIYSNKEENAEDNSYEDNKQRLKEEIYFASETLGSIGKAIDLAKQKKWNLNYGIPDDKWDDVEADIEADMDDKAYDYEPGDGSSEDAEMPANDFNKLKQHINKSPIQIKKPSKELPYTHNYIHDLAKQDPREEHKEENAEKYVYDGIEVAFNINGREYIAYGDVHFGEEDIHGKGEDTVENFAVVDAQTNQEVQDDAVLKHGYNAVYNAGVNQSAEENEERRIDPKCWKGYHKSGTKLKGGVRVNNCVKNK